MVAVPDLDLDDVRPVRRLAGDREGLREAEADDGGLDQHERSLMRTAARRLDTATDAGADEAFRLA